MGYKNKLHGMPGRITWTPRYKKGRKTSKGFSARKTWKSKSAKSKYIKYIPRPRTSIFGKQYFCKLRYQTLVELDSITSGMVQHSFKINSLYDPDDTGMGAQPLFYDTLCAASGTNAPFANYRVCGAKVKVYFVNDNTAASTAGAFFIHWRYGGAGPLDTISELGEQPNTIVKDVNSGYSPRGTTMLATYVSMKKMLGVRDIRDDDDSAGPYNGNPAKIVYFDAGYQPYQAAVNSNVFLRVKITFYCQFYSQNEMLQS